MPYNFLFSEHESSVYFAPVYGRVVTTQGQRCGASPGVPKFEAMMSFEAATLVGDKTGPLPSFTVVPLHTLSWYGFGFFSNKVFENSHEILCQKIASYKPSQVFCSFSYAMCSARFLFGSYPYLAIS